MPASLPPYALGRLRSPERYLSSRMLRACLVFSRLAFLTAEGWGGGRCGRAAECLLTCKESPYRKRNRLNSLTQRRRAAVGHFLHGAGP